MLASTCQIFAADCTTVNAYATVVLAGAALLALLANVFLAWKTSQATRATIALATANWPILRVDVNHRSGTEPDVSGKISNVGGALPAMDLTVWLHEGERYFGPFSTGLLKADDNLTFRLNPKKPSFWSKFHRLPKGKLGSPAWGIQYRLPDGKRIYRTDKG